ncbi:uncharacterized protein LOC142637228 [Castanea sativa]|uniref:uncharacterized protein LOC142637228 n=1 Tax=Castanea sativa TaxID=21020 RepID=UPI003F652402
MTKSHAIKSLLQQTILFGRISQWLLQLSQYDLKARTPKAVKIQAIADLLAQFPGEEEFPLDEGVPGEVATAEEVGEWWLMKFDGSSTAQSGGVGVVLYHEENEVVALSFKLEFPCLNNTAEYEAYLTRLATALEMGAKHLKVVGDSNLAVYQTKGSFSLKEPSLALYRAMAQKIEERFSTFEIEHASRGENRFADALATLGSQIIFEGNSAKIEVSKRRESIIEVLKEKFREEQCEEDWRNPIKEALIKEGEPAELKALKDYTLAGGELYRRMPGGILSRCVGQKEAYRKLKEMHEKTCGSCREISLYRRLQMAGPVNPPSRGYIWILVATEYFTKWAEAVPLRKATGGAMANFIKENIIVRFGVPHRIISDNGTPFVNNDVRKMLEFYQVKHHRSSPYYP